MLSADFSKAGEAVTMIGRTDAQWIHLDVMDGMFVPNISFGSKFIADIRPLSDLVFDTHLMVAQPERYIKAFAEAGSDYITVHAEACLHLNRTVSMIHEEGKKAGVSLVPSTPVSSIELILDDIDLVLIMSVNPGFGGQKFIPSTMEKIHQLDRLRKERGLDFKISIDGGVNESNGGLLVDAGVDILVMGSAFFGSEDREGLVKKLQGRTSG
jgi:ribulose-phosphate 3-epimerase